MTPEELRQRQAPIKARYRAEPAAARQTFRAEALLHPEKPSCRIETRFAAFDAGLPGTTSPMSTPSLGFTP